MRSRRKASPCRRRRVPKLALPRRLLRPPLRRPPPAAAAEESAWVKLCLKNEQTGGKQVCLVNHEGLEPNTGMVLVAAAVRSIEGDDKQHLLVRLPTAYSLVMPAGVQIKIDEGEPIQLQYAVCFPTSCQVQMELSKEIVRQDAEGQADDRRCHEHAAEGDGLPGAAHRFQQDLRRTSGRQRAVRGSKEGDDGEIPSSARWNSPTRLPRRSRRRMRAGGQAQADGTAAPAPERPRRARGACGTAAIGSAA